MNNLQGVTIAATAGADGADRAVSGRDAAKRPRKASVADLPGLSETLAAAFFDDPVFGWAIPDAEPRREIQRTFFAAVAEAYLPHDELYVTEDLVAGAVWTPPGAEEDGEGLEAALADVFGEYAPRAFKAFELMEEQHPHDPHHYLFFLGTRPEWQSKGIGSALMLPILERCDREGTPAYLEATSERNRHLYLRHGFELAGEIRLPDGPSIWPMWREPR